MKTTKLGILALVTLTSLNVSASNVWDIHNDPNLMKIEFERNFEKLPLAGQTEKQPWSGDYWPSYKGGISQRWNLPVTNPKDKWNYQIPNIDSLNENEIRTLSPAEKYDLLIGNKDFSLTNYERQRTGILKTLPWTEVYDASFEIPKWEGICHAWAPSTVYFENPDMVVATGALGHTIEFSSSDIKALLSSFVDFKFQEVDSVGIGSRCNIEFKELEKKFQNGLITKEELLAAINSAECTDTNAGAFHMVLTNLIGIKKENFIVDITRDAEVWNQPVYKFNSKVLSKTDTVSADAAIGTKSQVEIFTQMYYIGEVAQSVRKELRADSIKEARYRYILDLNADGEILGGKWISDERPDFIYQVTKVPAFSGYFEALNNLYSRSIKKTSLSSAAASWKKLKFSVFKEKHKEEFVKMLKNRLTVKKMKKASASTVLKNLFIKRVKRSILYKKFKKKSVNTRNVVGFIGASKLAVKKKDELTRELINAVRSKDLKKIEKYLLDGARPNGNRGEVKDEELINSVIHPRTIKLAKLFVEKGASLNSVLIKGAQLGDMDLFYTFVKAGANVNYILEEHKVTPLMIAAQKGNVEMVKTLLEKGASETINYVGFNNQKRTALSLAIIAMEDNSNRDQIKIVELLVKHGADPKIKDARNRDAFDLADKFGGRNSRKLARILKK